MPHSGGGGSHSGGFSGGSGGSSGSGNSIRTQRTPFAGCHTFVVYDRYGHNHLIYSNQENYKEETAHINWVTPILLFFMSAVMLVISIVCFIGFASSGSAPNWGDSVPSIEIMDPYDLVPEEEEETLKESLASFRDDTGIIPAVEFTKDEAWKQDFTDMEAFAYDQYVSNFDDEKHLLLIYSYGPVNVDTGFNEFNWHTMWGDDLSSVAGESDEEWLADSLQQAFVKANGSDVPAVTATVFTDFTEEIKASNKQMGIVEAVIGVILLVLGILCIVGGVRCIRDMKKTDEKVKADGIKTYKITGDPEIRTCSYCGCTYYKGTVGSCPHCGAPLGE